MRQVGVLAAAGLYALDHHVERLAEDHEHARLLAEACGADPALTETNIVVVEVPDAPAVVAAAREQGVLVGAVGPTRVRMLTHLDVSRADVEQAAEVLAELVRRRTGCLGLWTLHQAAWAGRSDRSAGAVRRSRPPSAADHRRQLAHGLGQRAQVGAEQRLRAVAERVLGVGVHVDDDAVGADARSRRGRGARRGRGGRPRARGPR